MYLYSTLVTYEKKASTNRNQLTTDGRFLGVDEPASNMPTVLVDSCAFFSIAE